MRWGYHNPNRCYGDRVPPRTKLWRSLLLPRCFQKERAPSILLHSVRELGAFFSNAGIYPAPLVDLPAFEKKYLFIYFTFTFVQLEVQAILSSTTVCFTVRRARYKARRKICQIHLYGIGVVSIEPPLHKPLTRI